MAKKKNLSKQENTGSAKNMSFGIVVSEWNEKITSSLLKACRKTLLNAGAKESDLHLLKVPGSFELALGAKWLAAKKKTDAIICLGCIIKGETQHDEYIASAVSKGIMSLNLAMNLPVIFGVLTPSDYTQAEDRAGGKHGNKGVEAAATAIRMVQIKRELKETDQKIGF